MKILTGAITTLASEGRITLQVPQYAIDSDQQAEYEDCPDEWFVFLKGSRPAIGRESGFLHLTRAGFESNESAIRNAFVAAVANGHDRGPGCNTWSDFTKHAEEEFARREAVLATFIANLQSKLNQAESLLAAGV